jgi:putative ATPase
MQCLPDNLKERRYYQPTSEGVEKRIRARLEEIRRNRQHSGEVDPPRSHGDAEE